MLITKFCRIGTVVSDEQNNVIPGSYRFAFWDEKGTEGAFKLGVPEISGVAAQVELCEFTSKDGKKIKFYKFLQTFSKVADITETADAISEVDSLDRKIKAMF